MATRLSQDKDFMSTVVGVDFLERAIEWIQKNLSPEDVFAEQTLIEWARAGDDPTEVFSATRLQAWAKDQLVTDVCTESELRNWDEENGYVKEEVGDETP